MELGLTIENRTQTLTVILICVQATVPVLGIATHLGSSSVELRDSEVDSHMYPYRVQAKVRVMGMEPIWRSPVELGLTHV
jgi:hypothetical protein